MILKQLKQLTLSATRRNADVLRLAKFYSSPAVCQTLKTSKAYKRLSKDDRRAAVESFVSKAANAGRFPSLSATHKEVGGGYYFVRKIFQELKLKPEAFLPIVAKALSDVPASVPDDASSQTLNDPQSHSSACNAKHLSPVVVQAGRPDTIEIGSDQAQATIDSSHPNSHEPNLLDKNLVSTATNDKQETQTASNDEVDRKYDSNLVITATHDKTETETDPNNEVDSKCDSHTHFPESKAIVLEESSKTSETDEKENLTRLGSQESKADHHEGAAVSGNVLPTETRQVSEKGAGGVKTGENSSAWSNMMSIAREFANFWRTR
ncbi:uncharacterized protein LOC18016838 isoform X2 [Eutrema salsugineum]|uniref:uncharacterized protein LOC18016838 isoform X2 n=1 Tax=Eutrema salsugineum TaxID=72664 RepID=UPI000CED0246|nr:uncharacterized protein LOC18016838 isoform X2 [Eutrema salsugineum]